ncbi:MAG: outer membrane protein assembly factor BamE [Pseudomonadota bacterium]
MSPRLPSSGKIPFVHRIEIQQGNVVTQEMLAQLERGMEEKKVRFIMGTPIIADTFNSHRWDYLFTLQEDGGEIVRRQITLVFKDDVLDYIEGDITPALGRLEVDIRQDKTVTVPEWEGRSLTQRIVSVIPFTGDDDDKEKDEQEESAPDAEDGGSEKSFTERLAGVLPFTGDDEQDQPQEEELGDSATLEDDSLDAGDEQAQADTETLLANAESVVVPSDAPRRKIKEKGLVRRFLDSVGLDADEDDYDDEFSDPKYRNITDPDD